MKSPAAEFVQSLRDALEEPAPQAAVDVVLRAAVSSWNTPPEWLDGPSAKLETLYADSRITIMNTIWPPKLITEPHNHNMWASIALYKGRENNVLWRRDGTSIVPVSAHTIAPGEVFSLGADAIHSVHNPLDGYTGAIHVYGGDFFNQPKSEWDPEHLLERPREMANVEEAFMAADTSR